MPLPDLTQMRWTVERLEGKRVRVSAELSEEQTKEFFTLLKSLEKVLMVRAQLEGVRMLLEDDE